ncbi:sigma-54-dependent transcriptional regulator [Marinobacter litoralis]|uniref:sigma-54-dependent transcriptional regulator n=1 Tax=Marinobacter litoralis TaxID=187981 RepID=UPI0018EA5CD2|nr:sigma-54 dependent transcriptional regulator [Marinobacter litoralis]MBJ6138927.1 sigma-54-dependent Fis family transcriptional regulator [Marinobacter litoralis]
MPGEHRPSVLLIEDSPSNAMVYQSYLQSDYAVRVAHTGAEALEHLANHDFDVLITDVRLPDMSGLNILDKVKNDRPLLPVIVITAHGSVDMVVDAMHRGASDFISKPFDKARLAVTLSNILKKQKLEEVVQQYEKVYRRDEFYQMIGASLPMQNVYRIVESAGKSNASVFITGESGTGKELCSEALHAESPRAASPFIALNCAAIPRELIESEIFGHVKGAFTGASSARDGAALRASGGTLFLDEIGEMPLDLQSKLLRLIQSGTFTPVGSSKEVKVDIRFICATNRDPLLEVQEGRFREDLYYRLHVIPIHMPALRERGSDIMLIAQELLEQYAQYENKTFQGFSDAVENFFLQYSWPGNVRELSNVIRNIVVLNDGDIIEMSMLPNLSPSVPARKNAASEYSVAERGNRSSLSNWRDKQRSEDTQDRTSVSEEILPLWIQEKRIIEETIELCDGNVPKAAAFLEISASTIYRKKQQWDKELGEKR